jgi:hypothetical protein
MNRRLKLLLTLAGWFGLCCTPVVLAAPAAPSIVISETGFNFGDHLETAPVLHDFAVQNTGGTTLNIRDVKPGCGCTIARFDRTIPPGGEGKVTLKLDVSGFQGYVKKTATVISDDPAHPRVVLYLEGTVTPLIAVLPEKTVSFQGMPENLKEKVVDFVSTSHPFRIRKVEDDLGGKVAYGLETVEDGHHYRIRISNKARHGNYRGSITLHTDFSEKPELTVWVSGNVEGEIAVRPTILILGRLSPDQGVITGKVLVKDNLNRAFKILKCTYDERIVTVVQSPLPGQSGFSLEVTPKMQNIPAGGRIETRLTIETDTGPEEKQEVQIQAINLGDTHR